MIEGGRVELYELHVFYRSLGAVDHRYAVACGCHWICSCRIDGADASGRHEGHARQKLVDGALRCKHIGAVASYVGRAPRHNLAQMVLGYDLDGEMMFEDVDHRMGFNGCYEALLDLKAGVVGMVENAEFAVAPLAVEVERAVGGLVEINAPLYQLGYLGRRVADNLGHSFGVAEPVSGYHCVVDMLVEVVDGKICHRSHASLSQSGVRFFESRLADQGHTPSFGGDLEGKAHAGYAAADDEIIILVCHLLFSIVIGWLWFALKGRQQRRS